MNDFREHEQCYYHLVICSYFKSSLLSFAFNHYYDITSKYSYANILVLLIILIIITSAQYAMQFFHWITHFLDCAYSA